MKTKLNRYLFLLAAILWLSAASAWANHGPFHMIEGRAGNLATVNLDGSLNFTCTSGCGGGTGGTASNYSSNFPTQGTAIGIKDQAGTPQMQPIIGFDYDTGAGTQWIPGVGIILPGSGGGVLGGTASNPIVVNCNSGCGTISGSTVGAAVPATAVVIGGSDGTNTQIPRVSTGNPAGSEMGLIVRNIPSGTQAISAASLPLPTGAATSAKQPALGTAGSPSADVISIQGVASGTVVPISGSISCSNCSGSGASATDNSAFTGGSGSVAPAGFLYDTTPPTITDGNAGLARMDTNRFQIMVGSGTAGSAAGGVLTVQGVASMTPLLATLSGTNNINTVSTVTNLSQMGGTAISMNTGTRDAGTQRVTIATNDVVPASQSGTWNITNISGTISLPTGAATESSLAKLTVAQGAALGSNTQVMMGCSVTTNAPTYTTGQISPCSSDTSGGIRVNPGQLDYTKDNVAAVGSIASGSADSGNPVKIGGKYNATPITLTDGQRGDAQVDVNGYLKVNVAAGSASNSAASATGSAVPANADYTGINVSGTLRGATGVNPSGSIYAQQLDLASVAGTTVVTGGVNGSQGVGGLAAHDAAVAGNPMLMGCSASAAAPTDVSADADAVRAWCLRNGARATVLTAAGALIGGDATNGLDVDVTRVSGNVTVVQSTGTNLHVVCDSGCSGSGGTSSSYGSAFPATGTAIGFSDGANMQGARVYDTDSGAGTQYTAGVVLRKSASGGSVELGTSSDPIRTDPTGTTTQPVSGTVTVNAGTGNFAMNLAQVNGSSVSTAATGVQKVGIVGNAGAAMDAAGQNASSPANSLLIGCQFNTSPTTITSGNMSPIQCGNNGHVLATIDANSPVNISQVNGVTPLMGAGNAGTGSFRVTEATDSQLSAGVGATGDAAATAGSTGSLSAKQRLMTSQLDTIQTAVQLIDDDQTGSSVNYHTSVGTTEDETEIKATAGRLFSITATNTNAAARYLRCYNLTAANTTPGTSTVFIGLAIPANTAGNGFTVPFGPSGIAFSTALTCTLTTGAADTDVAEVAANEIKWIIAYK